METTFIATRKPHIFEYIVFELNYNHINQGYLLVCTYFIININKLA